MKSMRWITTSFLLCFTLLISPGCGDTAELPTEETTDPMGDPAAEVETPSP